MSYDRKANKTSCSLGKNLLILEKFKYCFRRPPKNGLIVVNKNRALHAFWLFTQQFFDRVRIDVIDINITNNILFANDIWDRRNQFYIPDMYSIRQVSILFKFETSFLKECYSLPRLGTSRVVIQSQVIPPSLHAK